MAMRGVREEREAAMPRTCLSGEPPPIRREKYIRLPTRPKFPKPVAGSPGIRRGPGLEADPAKLFSTQNEVTAVEPRVPIPRPSLGSDAGGMR